MVTATAPEPKVVDDDIRIPSKHVPAIIALLIGGALGGGGTSLLSRGPDPTQAVIVESAKINERLAAIEKSVALIAVALERDRADIAKLQDHVDALRAKP